MAPPSVISNASVLSGTELTERAVDTAVQHQQKSQIAELDASKLKITYTTTPKDSDPSEAPNPSWRHDKATDHMITCMWTDENGWEAPELKPYGPFQIMPTASVLHYATECFEGMKCYRGFDGKLRLFRPERNANRMLASAVRVALPPFDEKELVKLVETLVGVDGKKWLPNPGSYFYVRPSMIGTHPALGVIKPKEAMLFIIITAFPKLDSKPMKLLASQENTVRAWPGGFGYAKLGANYGPSLMAAEEAKAMGYDQILWLLGKERLVTEAGASNFFVIWKNKETGKPELITAPLDDKVILNGVTRRSALDLASERLSKGCGDLEPLTVSERKYTMHDLVEAHKEGRLLEAFAAGTAYFIVACSEVRFGDVVVNFPIGQTDDGCNKYSAAIKKWLKDTMFGKDKPEWAPVVDESLAFKQ